MAGRPGPDVFVSEIEFLVSCDVGEAAILQAFGSAAAVERRAGRPDLVPRVFQYQAQLTEEQRLMGIYRKYARNK